MRQCPNCGNNMPSDSKNCPYCGAPNASHAVPPSPVRAASGTAHKSAPSTPLYAKEKTVCADGGLTTAQYFWSLLLFAIPVVGWIILIYCACTKSVLPARRRLARAVLLKTCVILCILLILLGILITDLFFAFRSAFTEPNFNYPGDMPAPEYFEHYYDEFYEDFRDEYYQKFFEEFDSDTPPQAHHYHT